MKEAFIASDEHEIEEIRMDDEVYFQLILFDFLYCSGFGSLP